MKRISIALAFVCGVACGGSAGPAGPPGPAGPAGPSGATVSSTRACAVSGATNFGPALSLVYQVVTYSNGEKQVDCTVADNNRGYSESVYLKAGASGQASSQCAVLYDVENDGTGGFFTFRNDNVGGVADRVTYTDAASAKNNTTAAFVGCQ